MTLTITSTAFADHGEIPARYTCEGDDCSPPLSWSGIPAGTKSLVLIIDDPDAPDPAAPKMTWVHWLLYNLPTANHRPAGSRRARCRPVRSKASTTSGAQPTAVPAHRSAAIATSTSCMRSMWYSPISSDRPRQRWRRPWLATCWRRHN